MFTAYPGYSPYRTLTLLAPQQQGEDVYALQLGINAVTGRRLIADGVLGPKTYEGIKDAQRSVGAYVDGKAGQLTQRGIALTIVAGKLDEISVVKGLTEGQLLHESSGLLGNFSPRRADGSYDAGVAQMNTAHWEAKRAFDPVFAIGELVATERHAYDLYGDKLRFRGDDHSERRRWALAAGSWNAPAFANYLAGVRPWAVPSAAGLARFEEYMAAVTVYVP